MSARSAESSATPTTAGPSARNARTITRNSFWYAFDSSAASVVMLIASVPVARLMGPEVLGHYIYLLFVTGVAQRLGNVGIPAVTCKYMAEHLGRSEPAVAHAIFKLTLRQQAIIAAAITAGGCVLVHFFAEPDLHLVSYMIVLSMWPSMVNNIPAQANVAMEDLRANVPGNAVFAITNVLLIVAALVFNWGLTGLASATLAARSAEAVVRYWGVHRWIRSFGTAPLPPELKQRMFSFSRQNLGLLMLGLVVWDRSELLFLKHFSPTQQIAFYSLAFSIVNQLLMAPRAFSSATGTTIFAQYGRDPQALAGLIDNATRYIALMAFPMFVGLAVIAAPLISFAYGHRYDDVGVILALMSVLAIPRAFQIHIENALQATEEQGFMFKWLLLAGTVNIALDLLLIPRFGALGAVIANGCGQGFAIFGLWMKTASVLRLQFPLRFIGKVAASAASILIVVPLLYTMPPLLRVIFSVLGGALLFLVMLRATRTLELEDLRRFVRIGELLPTQFRDPFTRSLRLFVATPSPDVP